MVQSIKKYSPIISYRFYSFVPFSTVVDTRFSPWVSVRICKNKCSVSIRIFLIIPYVRFPILRIINVYCIYCILYSYFLVISSYLGYGSRSLILIPIVSYLYPLYGNGLLDSFLNPAYLVPIVPAAICATIIGITRPRSPTYPFSKYIRHLVTTGVSLTVSFIIVIFTSLESTYSVLFTVTTCFALILTILLILSEDSYSNAGPFYSVGRRTTVLQVSNNFFLT